jgi:uncharacterized protein (TIGR02266 family)
VTTIRRRRWLRVPLRVQVERSDGPRIDYAINLSPGGICVQTLEPSPPGTRLALSFEIDPDQRPIRVVAEVAWCVQEEERAEGLRFSEMGLRFVEVSGADAEAIERFVERQTKPLS